MRNWKVVAGLMAGVAASAAVYAQQKGGKTLTAQDYAEIQQLYVRYAWSIDTMAENGMAYAKTFTEDGEFLRLDVEVRGRRNLAEYIRKAPHGKPSHYLSNILIEPAPEGARGGAYLLGPARAADANAPAKGNSTGSYEDILVKTSEGWRFKKRTLRPDAMPPSIIGASSSN